MWSARTFQVLVVLTFLAGIIVDNAIKGFVPLWVRAPLVGLVVGLAVLVVSLVYKRKDRRKS